MIDLDVLEINEFLLKKWDPIEVSNIPEAYDEYYQYANDILKIIKNSSTYEELFKYLWRIETQNMGLKDNKAKTKKIAQMLFIRKR